MVADSAFTSRRLRVLVVDDNRDFGYLLLMLLRSLGHEGRHVYDSPSALATAIDFRPQLILLDLAMPNKDGLSVIRDLRAEACFEKVPIIAVTGYADAHHRELAAEAGFNAYLVKPCKVDDLQQVIQSVEDSDGERLSTSA